MLKVGKKDEELTIMMGKVITETEEAKILGYVFNKEGNCKKHLEQKEKEVIGMMAKMGLSIKEANMDKMFMPAILAIYTKCFIPKLLYGLAGVPLKQSEIEHLERINRKVLRNILNLPSSSPKIALYNEFGVIPIEYMLYKRKLGMWKRINTKATNHIIKECKKIQIEKDLPWGKEIVKIAVHLNIDLTKAVSLSKEKWKQEVNIKVIHKVKEIMIKEIDSLKRYKQNIKDDITPGVRKKYMLFSQKQAKIWCRMRMDIADPEPRMPYNRESIWKCKFCNEQVQSTEHYLVDCIQINDVWNGRDRREIYNIIQTLEAEEDELKQITTILLKVNNELQK